MRKKTNSSPTDPVEEATPKPKRTPKPKATEQPEVPTEKPVAKRSAKKPLSAEASEASPKVASKPAAAKKVSKPAEVVAQPAPKPEPPKKKLPAAVMSLAELVEEEAKNPKPRPKKAPAPKAKADEAPKEPAPEFQMDGEASLMWRKPSGDPKKKPIQNKGRQPRREPAPAPEPQVEEPVAEVILEEQDFGEGIVVLWRNQTAGQKPGKPLAERKSARGKDRRQKPEVSDEPKPEPRNRRTRDRRDRDESPDQEPLQVTFRAPEPPKPPTKPTIPIPDDAPQIVVRNGIPTLVKEGVVYPPLIFFGSTPDERRAQTVLSEIRRACDAGIHIHTLLIDLEVDKNSVDQTVGFAAYMIAKVIEIDPKAQILMRMVIAAPKGWESIYPDAKYNTEQGRTADPSVCDLSFWTVARECLTDFVKQIRALDFKSHLLGVHLDRGEWFIPGSTGYDTSKAATGAFRDWLRMRYVNDLVAFRAAWFDGQVQFSNVQIPEFRAQNPEGEMFMRISRRERRWVDYHLFISDTTMSRIADLAYAVKEATEGYFLVGVSYGYTFEWTHPSSGHLSLGKLLRTREVDFIAGPPSYRSREPGGDAPFPCPIDSLALNGKMYFSEEDYKTAIGDYREPDDYNPVIRTPQALEAVHWRGVGAALAHSSGAFWMDLWGNGWLNTSTIWDRGSKVLDQLILRMGAPVSDPDVAVFIDERALAYLVDEHSFALLVQDVRESVLRSGLSVGFYLMSDLAHREVFPESKLNIFVNAWDIRPEHRTAIKNRLQKDGKVLFWLYCAGMFDNGREALERAREVTGIAIKPQPFHSKTGTTILNRRHPLCEAFAGKGLIGGAAVDPSYFAIPEQAVVLGEYSSSGLPSFVVREFKEDPDPTNHWTSVFLGEPFVTPGLLRALAQMAGAHIWNYHSDVVHVRPPFLTIHTTGVGQRAIALPRNWSAYNLQTQQWETEESSNIKFHALDGATYLFLVGERHDLEQILAADPAEMLKMETLPERQDESHMGDLLFDVPIMRLGDLVEDVGDEVDDDWFLKPLLIETQESTESDSSQEDRVGRRRRKRKPASDIGSVTKKTFDEDAGMNIMFRKRE